MKARWLTKGIGAGLASAVLLSMSTPLAKVLRVFGPRSLLISPLAIG
jgi:hypothetical protein